MADAIVRLAGDPPLPVKLHDNGDGTWSLAVYQPTSPSGGGAVTVADGADVAEGQVGDAVVAAGAAGSISAKLRRISADIAALLTGIVLGNGENHIGQVGGHVATPTASFVRPADVTQYAVGDLVANSTVAGNVVPLSWLAARVAAGSLLIRRVRLRKTGTSVTGGSFRLHLYSASPTVANGDNAAWSSDQAATYLGAFDVTMDRAFTDGSGGNGSPLIGSELAVSLGAGQTIYGLLEARGTYTPVSGETISATLELMQN